MDKKQILPDGHVLLIDNVVPLKLEPIALPTKGVQQELLDNIAPGSNPKVLRSYRAVGAVADTRYHSGRVIPAEVQERAIQKAIEDGRQMLMYIDHPAPGVNCGMNEGSLGRVALTAGIACKYHYDSSTKETILDRIDVIDVPEGRKFVELIDAGVLFGLSQRAVGEQEISKMKDESGEERIVLLVTNIWDILGWDFVHLDAANAGRVTQLQPLSDKCIHALRSSVSDSSDLGIHDKTQELDLMGKQRTENQANNHTPPKTTPQQLNDAKALSAQELGAQLAQENIKLEETIVELIDKVQETATGFKGRLDNLNDDFKSLYTNIESTETLYTRIYTAADVARREVRVINNDGNLSTAEKNAKLQELLQQMKECFSEISEAYVMAHMKAPDGSNENANDKRTDASTQQSKLNDKSVSYVPPVEPSGQESTVNDSLSASSSLRDDVKALIQKQSEYNALIDLKQYAKEAVARQKLEDKTSEAVLGLVEKMIHPGSTKEQIEDGIKDSIQLVKAGQASERLAGMGHNGKGVSNMSVQVLGDNHAFGGSHLEGAKLLTDSLEATGQFSLAHKEKKSVPPKLQKVLDRYDELNAGQLSQERKYLLDMKERLGKGKDLLDATTEADFNTPATIGRIVLFEVYAADIIR